MCEVHIGVHIGVSIFIKNIRKVSGYSFEVARKVIVLIFLIVCMLSSKIYTNIRS